MTVSFANDAPEVGPDDLPLVPDSSSHATSGSRFTLCKRPVHEDVGAMNLSSYNSDFLSGLFADVAKVSVFSGSALGSACPESATGPSPSSLGPSSKRRSEEISAAEPTGNGTDSAPSRRRDRLVSQETMMSNKKSRISMSRCLSIARPSTLNLTSTNNGAPSPKGIADLFSRPSSSKRTPSSSDSKAHSDLSRHDSLAFQLNCVSGSSPTIGSTLNDDGAHKAILDAADVVFPHLPATVSNSSCNAGLTRSKPDLQVSASETDNKESFGWFVDLDDDNKDAVPPQPLSVFAFASGSADLAFHAPTAPKRVNDDAELEWARAADTVDDVLGDFF